MVMDLSWKQGVDAKKGIATSSKGEIGVKRAPVDLVRNDPKTDHALKSHAGTPERHVITGTVHGRMDTMTEGQNHRRNGNPTVLPWTP